MMDFDNKCHVFETNKGWGFISIQKDQVNRLYLPMVTKTLAHKEAAAWGSLQKTAHNSFAANLIKDIKSYFSGEKVDFSSVPVDMTGVPSFHLKAYKALKKVGYGSTLSYGTLAKKIGAPNGARAVGQAMGRNQVPLIIPCHRVLSANKKLTGFTAPGGLTTKAWLLKNESLTST